MFRHREAFTVTTVKILYKTSILYCPYRRYNNNNQAVYTDRDVTASRPDIIKSKKDKTCTLTDLVIRAD